MPGWLYLQGPWQRTGRLHLRQLMKWAVRNVCAWLLVRRVDDILMMVNCFYYDKSSFVDFKTRLATLYK